MTIVIIQEQKGMVQGFNHGTKKAETIHVGLQSIEEYGPGNKRWVHYTYNL